MKTLLSTLVLCLFFASPAVAEPDYRAGVFLYKIQMVKVVEAPLDFFEDLYGTVRGFVRKFAPYSLEETVLWKVEQRDPLKLREGEVRTINTQLTSGEGNMHGGGGSLNEILGVKLEIGGTIADDEFTGPVRYECSQCSATGVRVFALRTYEDQIRRLGRGESTFLRIGGDDTFQLDFYERGDRGSSHVRMLFKIQVRRTPRE